MSRSCSLQLFTWSTTRLEQSISISRGMTGIMSSPSGLKPTLRMILVCPISWSTPPFVGVKSKLQQRWTCISLTGNQISRPGPILQDVAQIAVQFHECVYFIRPYHLPICDNKSTRLQKSHVCLSGCYVTSFAE